MAESGAGSDTDLPEAEAGHPVLVFLNTVSDAGKSRASSTFTTGRELFDQLRRGGVPVPGDPPGSGQLPGLLILREAAYGVLSAIAAGRRASREDALVLEAAIKSAVADAEFAPNGEALPFRPGPLGGLHDVIALGLLDLLGSPDLARLRECRRCTRLFVDHGRGPGRRWCSMARCGNRAKAQGFRDRRRAIE